MADPIKSNGRKSPSSHAIGRCLAQWVLPVLAVVVLLVIFRGSVMQIRTLKSMIAFDLPPDDNAMSCWMEGPGNRTPDQELILNGDHTRKTLLAREKAIWEKWPTNIVYLHNYITYLTSLTPYHAKEAKTNLEWRASYAQEITKLQPLDPGNARLDYILAGNLLAQAIEDQHSETNADGTVTNKWGMKVLDRAKLDQAMAYFKVGLGKAEFRRHTDEMVAERLAIMGKPTTLLKQIAEIGMVAGVLLPDLSTSRQLVRTSMAYARLLIDEGRMEEAREFLSACRHFVPQINNDSFTLIDVLVVGAVAGIVAEQMPAAYERLGDAVAAQQASIETAALAQPVKDWRKKLHESLDNPAGEKTAMRHAGILAGLLLPALGEYPTVADLTPSRLLEYIVTERGAAGTISVCLVVLMAFCGFLSLYYHWMSKTAPRSVYLLPRGRDWGQLLLGGVVLPVLCYYGVTRWVPWCNRSLSPALEHPQLITQLIALFLMILTVTFTITSRWVRKGCRDLVLPDAPAVPFFWRAWGCSLVGVLVLLAALPESWLTKEDMPGHAWTAYLPAIIGGALALSGLVYLVYGIVRRQWFRNTYAAYYGSFTRTLIPAIALVAIVLNILAQPYLFREERHLIATDTVMHIDPGGGSAIESRIVQRLKAEMQQAAARFPELRARSGN